MEQKEFDALVAKVGEEAAKKIKAELEAYKASFQTLLTQQKELTETQVKEHRDAMENAVKEVKAIVEKQGMSVTEILTKLEGGSTEEKSIAQKLYDDREDLRKIFKQGTGAKTYMIVMGKNGKPVMKEIDTTKAAGPHASIPDVGTPGNTASITQSIDAATLLRMGAGSPVYDIFRNTPWIFPLVNSYNAGFNTPFIFYFNETPKQGSSAAVAEGGTKPKVQYAYELKSDTYKKEAALVQFTEEFDMDFEGLHNRIMSVAEVDLLNRINTAVLGRLKTAATAYNKAADFIAAGDPIATANDWHAIAAMAAQVESSTFTNMTNAVLVNTNKKYRLGTIQNGFGDWLNAPQILNGISMVSNPELGNDEVIVGDLKQYNLAFRGGIIVRVGYNGTDFAENRYSTVIEQFYFDWISTARTPAIVKGPDFATVKSAIESGSAS